MAERLILSRARKITIIRRSTGIREDLSKANQEKIKAVFHDNEFKLHDISLSLCSIVARKGKNTIYKPAQKVISILHIGDYPNLSKAYTFLFEYCQKKKLKICGDPIEYYLTGTGIKSISDFILTEVCFPIK